MGSFETRRALRNSSKSRARSMQVVRQKREKGYGSGVFRLRRYTSEIPSVAKIAMMSATIQTGIATGTSGGGVSVTEIGIEKVLTAFSSS